MTDARLSAWEVSVLRRLDVAAMAGVGKRAEVEKQDAQVAPQRPKWPARRLKG